MRFSETIGCISDYCKSSVTSADWPASLLGERARNTPLSLFGESKCFLYLLLRMRELVSRILQQKDYCHDNREKYSLIMNYYTVRSSNNTIPGQKLNH